MFLLFSEHNHMFMTFNFALDFVRALSYYFIIAGWTALLFYVRKRHLLFVLVYLEVVLLGIGLLFLVNALFWVDGKGYVMFLVVLVIAAMETSLGLALFIVYHFATNGFIELRGNYLRKKQG